MWLGIWFRLLDPEDNLMVNVSFWIFNYCFWIFHYNKIISVCSLKKLKHTKVYSILVLAAQNTNAASADFTDHVKIYMLGLVNERKIFRFQRKLLKFFLCAVFCSWSCLFVCFVFFLLFFLLFFCWYCHCLLKWTSWTLFNWCSMHAPRKWNPVWNTLTEN